jgi:hypothetical protein
VSLHAVAALKTERWNKPHWDIPNLYVVNVGLGNELNTNTCQVGPQSAGQMLLDNLPQVVKNPKGLK